MVCVCITFTELEIVTLLGVPSLCPHLQCSWHFKSVFGFQCNQVTHNLTSQQSSCLPAGQSMKTVSLLHDKPTGDLSILCWHSSHFLLQRLEVASFHRFSSPSRPKWSSNGRKYVFLIFFQDFLLTLWLPCYFSEILGLYFKSEYNILLPPLPWFTTILLLSPYLTSGCRDLEVCAEGGSGHFVMCAANRFYREITKGKFQESRKSSQEKCLWSQKGILHLIFMARFLITEERGWDREQTVLSIW